MPPVFDVAAGQRLATPVTSYYQGKAMRLANQQLEQQIEMAPDIEARQQQETDIKQQRADLDTEKYDLAVDKFFAESNEKDREAMENASAAGLQVADEGGTSEEITQAVRDSLPQDDENKLPDDFVAEVPQLRAFIAKAEDYRKSGRTAQKFIDRDGNPVQGSMDKQGNYYDSSGKQRTDITPIAPAATQAELGALTRTQAGKNVADFQDTVVGAVGSVQTATELLKISFDTPSALGKSGALTNFANEMVATAKAIIFTAGYKEIKVSDRKLQDIGAEAFNWESLDLSRMRLTAVEAVAFKAGIFGIAFAAAVSEQGTRPTDVDIQQFIDQVAGRTTDPISFRRTIAQFMRRQDRRLRTIANVKGIPKDAQTAAFGEWDVAYAKFLAAAKPQEAVPEGYTGPTAKDKDGNLLILNDDETDWIPAP